MGRVVSISAVDHIVSSYHRSSNTQSLRLKLGREVLLPYSSMPSVKISFVVENVMRKGDSSY
jgi:hypothetical protein